MALSISPDIRSVITDAANRHGIDPMAMLMIAQLESGGNPNASNPKSSAEGLYQFIDSTAKQYGLENKRLPGPASDAAARLARDNTAILTKALGRAPTREELYLAHQQGAGGASKLLSNPLAPAASLVGENAVRLNGGNAGMTAQEFANLWLNKASGVLADEGGGSSPSAPHNTGAVVSQDLFEEVVRKALEEAGVKPENKLTKIGSVLSSLGTEDPFEVPGLADIFKKRAF